ncbi:MAG: B12-binding domain-containing radical SAM protein, partial [Acidobacteria bacterium]|nr:B12-binding domain-containing radical SAM protein [Acidobacteriota bacterium]
HETDFHQFMLYTPVPGTPLYAQMAEEGRLLNVDFADIHGQYQFNFKHPAISKEDSKKFLDWAFWRDFERNGPSLARICRTTLEGWKRYKNHPDPRIRERFQWEVRQVKDAYTACLWAMEKRLKRTNETVAEQVRALRREIEKEFGVLSRATSALLGPVLLWTTRREEKRLANGVVYEPPTILERRNWGEA